MCCSVILLSLAIRDPSTVIRLQTAALAAKAADKAKSSIRARLAERRAQLLAKRNQQSHRSPPSASSSASIRERLAAARARRDNAPQSAVADSFANKVVTERSPEVLDKTVESDANKTPGDSRPSSDSDEDVIGIG